MVFLDTVTGMNAVVLGLDMTNVSFEPLFSLADHSCLAI